MKADRRLEAGKLVAEMERLGFSRPDVPQEVEQLHIDTMKQDILIQQGRIREVMPALKSEMRALGLDRDPVIRAFTEVLERNDDLLAGDATGRNPQLDANPDIKDLVLNAAFGIHRAIFKRRDAELKAVKAKIAEDRRRRGVAL